MQYQCCGVEGAVFLGKVPEVTNHIGYSRVTQVAVTHHTERRRGKE